MFLEKSLHGKKLLERCLVVLGIIIVVAIVIEVISLHAYRHLREILLCLLIILQRGLKIVELQIDGGKSEIECDVLTRRQPERVYQKQGTPITRRSLRQLTLEDISIAQIGTNLRHLVFSIAVSQQGCGVFIESYHLIRILAIIMISNSLAIVCVCQ